MAADLRKSKKNELLDKKRYPQQAMQDQQQAVATSYLVNYGE